MKKSIKYIVSFELDADDSDEMAELQEEVDHNLRVFCEDIDPMVASANCELSEEEEE